MRAEGVVISVEGNGATISVVQESACAGCSASCANCHKSVTHDISVENSINAVAGERVWVESSGGPILLLCFLLFIVPPVISGICCALLWNYVSAMAVALIAIGVALLGFAVVYLTVGRIVLKKNSYRLVKMY